MRTRVAVGLVFGLLAWGCGGSEPIVGSWEGSVEGSDLSFTAEDDGTGTMVQSATENGITVDVIWAAEWSVDDTGDYEVSFTCDEVDVPIINLTCQDLEASLGVPLELDVECEVAADSNDELICDIEGLTKVTLERVEE